MRDEGTTPASDMIVVSGLGLTAIVSDTTDIRDVMVDAQGVSRKDATVLLGIVQVKHQA